MLVRYDVEVTTDADGDGSTTIGPIRGYLVAIHYDGNSAGFAANATVDIDGVTTDIKFFNSGALGQTSQMFYPRVEAQDETGTAILHAAAGTAVPAGLFPICDERVTVTIASGGDTKTGTVRLLVEEDQP